MNKFKFSLIVLVLSSSIVFGQSEPKCNCQQTQTDASENLIALIIAKSDEAPIYFVNQVEGKQVINEDLLLSAQILTYQANRWSQVDDLESHLKRLKKKKEKDANNYWITTNRLDCFDKIISALKSNKKYEAYKKLTRRERKKLPDQEHQEAVKKTYKKTYSTSQTKTVENANQQPVVTSPNGNSSPSNEEVLKVLEELKNKLKNKSTTSASTTSSVQDEYAKNKIESYTIYFKEGEINLDSKALETLKNIVQAISSHTISEIRIEGFASQTGSRETNFAISMSRCYEVKKALQAGGYENDITVLPYGETDNKDFRAVVITLRGK